MAGALTSGERAVWAATFVRNAGDCDLVTAARIATSNVVAMRAVRLKLEALENANGATPSEMLALEMVRDMLSSGADR